ncbi:MD-2-related lipid-recognition protein-like [Battus philenor]|uniref:MD-2-related lipid-recognition protein-like n=1 Tax=Battus philenor TaxID=42288 RepID=UPI0035CFEE26
MDARIFLISLCFLCVSSDYVIKKNCKEATPSLCSIHNVVVEPCLRGPRLCIVKPEKSYSINVDFTPHFSANGLKVAMYSDEKKTNSFETAIKTPADGCGLVACPLVAEERKNFDLQFTLAKMSPGKFPIKMKIYDEDDETRQCCFTFNVKIRK